MTTITFINVYEIAENVYETVEEVGEYPDTFCVDDDYSFLFFLEHELYEKVLANNEWNLSEEELAKQTTEFIAYYGFEPGNPPPELARFRKYPIDFPINTHYYEVPEKWLKAPSDVLESYKEYEKQQEKLYKAKRRAEQRAKQQAKNQAKTALA